MPTGDVRKLTTDPFERAAQREHREEVQRELLKQRVWKRMRSAVTRAAWVSSSSTFGLPYVVWGTRTCRRVRLRRSDDAGHHRRLFLRWTIWVFGAYTGTMLLLIWVTAIAWVAERWDS